MQSIRFGSQHEYRRREWSKRRDLARESRRREYSFARASRANITSFLSNIDDVKLDLKSDTVSAGDFPVRLVYAESYRHCLIQTAHHDCGSL